MPSEGDEAPAFELPDQDGNPVPLTDYHDEHVVLYFYPKAHTPGCTKEACSFRDVYDEFEERGIAVFGVSTDSVEDISSFAEEYDLPFRLLADEDGEVARAYDTFAVKEMRGEEYEIAERNTFVIDPDGAIAAVYEDVSPETHAEEILDDIDA
jgi:peroxiredoxin Q/BCP